MFLIKFAPGFGALVAEQLGKATRIAQVDEDIALFEAVKPPATPYASHLYRVLGSYRVKSMQELLRAAARDTRYVAVLRAAAQGETFRIRCLKADQAVRADAAQLLELERTVSRAGLSPHRDGAKHELRLWLRGREQGLFLLRVARPGEERKLPKGALRPDICHMLCLLAKVRSGDVCLDPFCGHGQIPRAMLQYAADVTAGDIDSGAVRAAQGIRGARALTCDALSDKLPAGRYTAIVTDPPWGIYKAQQRGDFLLAMFRSFRRLLAEGGRAAVLLERSMPAQDAAEAAGLTLTRRFDALYAGHKVQALLLTVPEEE